MPTFNEIIVTKKTDIAWDGGKATENLIPNDGDLVFDSTGGGTAIFKEVTGLKCEISVIEFSPDQDNGLLLPAVQTGGVSVACGDVGGDNGALGDPVTSDENFVYGGPENADGHAGQKGAWVADVTYERDLINLTGVNGLDGDHGGSTAPVEPRSYTAGHFALDIDGHSSSHLSFYDLIV